MASSYRKDSSSSTSASAERRPTVRSRPRKRLLTFNDPQPLRVDRGLAQEIGFLESLVLLQIEYHISMTNNLRDGEYWTYQTLDDLRRHDFPWLSRATVARTVKNLERMHLLKIGNYNVTGFDRTQWFALDYEGISGLQTIKIGEDAPISQNEKWMSQNATSISQNATSISPGETTIPHDSPHKITHYPEGSRSASSERSREQSQTYKRGAAKVKAALEAAQKKTAGE